MAARQFLRKALAGRKLVREHNQAHGLKVGVSVHGQTARAAAGVALFVVEPYAQAHLASGINGNDHLAPFLGVACIVASRHVGHHAAKALVREGLQAAFEKSAQLVVGPIRIPYQLMRDLERQVLVVNCFHVLLLSVSVGGDVLDAPRLVIRTYYIARK